jgi:hypothetical protein
MKDLRIGKAGHKVTVFHASSVERRARAALERHRRTVGRNHISEFKSV